MTGAVMPSLELSTTFAQQGPGQHKGFEYSRTNNPTRQVLEDCIKALEGGEHGMAFSSGCAATTVILNTLKPGDHVIASDDLYGGSVRIFDKVMAPLGLKTTYVDATDLHAVEKAFQKETKMVWLETPSNPLLKIIDIKAIAKMTQTQKALLVVDNTFATPILQQPLRLGADVVVHSATKYLNGHSDVVSGVVVTSHNEFAERLRFLQNAMGAIPAPFDCFMLLRGLKTLAIRVERHVKNAQLIAEWLQKHPQIERVIYPGLETHPHYALAKTQMSGCGGMISAVVRGGLSSARTILSSTRIFVCAESLGGVESLIESPALMTHAGLGAEKRAAIGISDGLIRLSVGIEAAEDLIADLDQAFARS